MNKKLENEMNTLGPFKGVRGSGGNKGLEENLETTISLRST